MFATELIRAIPAAAAAPPRNNGGSVQNTGSTAIIPACASDRPASASQGFSTRQATSQPAAAAASDTPTSGDRIRQASDSRLTITIATTAARCGSAVSSPTFQ